MCEIITRSPVDGMRAITHQPDPASPCLHPYFVSSMAAAQILRRNQKKKNQPIRLFWIVTGLKTARTCAKGKGGFPPNPPSTPLIVSFLSKAALREGLNVDGK